MHGPQISCDWDFFSSFLSFTSMTANLLSLHTRGVSHCSAALSPERMAAFFLTWKLFLQVSVWTFMCVEVQRSCSLSSPYDIQWHTKKVLCQIEKKSISFQAGESLTCDLWQRQQVLIKSNTAVAFIDVTKLVSDMKCWKRWKEKSHSSKHKPRADFCEVRNENLSWHTIWKESIFNHIILH